jgi:hypothetical protein
VPGTGSHSHASDPNIADTVANSMPCVNRKEHGPVVCMRPDKDPSKKQKKQKVANKNILYPLPCPATADQKNIFWAYKIV